MSLRPLLLAAALQLAACSATPAAPAAQRVEQEASASRGLAYAERVCAECHAVAGAAVSPNPHAPTFVVIANTPGLNAIALNAWLHSSHPSMPNLIVSPAERADLAAYLETLKDRAI